MKLSSADLKYFFSGAVSLFEEDGGVVPVRFTEYQMSVYAQNGTFALRAGASAGVCFGLHTDAERFSLSFRLSPGSTRDFYSLDLYADGTLYRSLKGLLSKAPAGQFCCDLPPGEKTLHFYLPNLQKTFLRDVELAGASFASPLPAPGRRLLCLGDSITQGFLSETHSLCYAARLSRLLGAELLNQGVGAERFHAETLDEDLPYKPDLVTIAYGTNDWSTKTPAQTEKDAALYLDRADELFRGSRVAVITPLLRLDENTAPRRPLSETRAVLEDLIAAHPGFTLIRGETLMPGDPDHLADHVHPNEKGFGVMTENLWKQLPASWKN